MRVLAIDPGITTGLCIYDSLTRTISTSVHRYSGPIALRNAITTEIEGYHPHYAIIERPPRSITRELGIIYGVCREACSRLSVFDVSPGEWKPIAGKVKLPFSPSTQHEKDAYRMARYWMFKTNQVPL